MLWIRAENGALVNLEHVQVLDIADDETTGTSRVVATLGVLVREGEMQHAVVDLSGTGTGTREQAEAVMGRIAGWLEKAGKSCSP